MEFSSQEHCSGLPFPSPGGSSWPRDQTQVSSIEGGFFVMWATREARFPEHSKPAKSPGVWVSYPAIFWDRKKPGRRAAILASYPTSCPQNVRKPYFSTGNSRRLQGKLQIIADRAKKVEEVMWLCGGTAWRPLTKFNWSFEVYVLV